MSEYRVSTVADYIEYRRKQISRTPLTGEIRFKTPVSIKFRGEDLNSFDIEPVYEAARRRVFMLDCFEGIESNAMEIRPAYPTVINEHHHKVSVRRYSNHTNSSMRLEGIEGSLMLEEIPENILDILLAGELMHIGKNTSFEFGRYRIKQEEQ